MQISENTRLQLTNILRDYLDLIRMEDFRPCGRAAVENILDQVGIPRSSPMYEDTVEEVTSKAITIWELEQLVDLLEKGVDEDEV